MSKSTGTSDKFDKMLNDEHTNYWYKHDPEYRELVDTNRAFKRNMEDEIRGERTRKVSAKDFNLARYDVRARRCQG